MRPSARSRPRKRKAEAHQKETAERGGTTSEELRRLTGLRVRASHSTYSGRVSSPSR
jgi:hypothetical protein